MASNYINLPAFGSPSWKPTVPTSASLPASGNSTGDARVTRDTSFIYVWSGSAWVLTAGGAGADFPHNTNILDMTGGTGQLSVDLANRKLYDALGTLAADWSAGLTAQFFGVEFINPINNLGVTIKDFNTLQSASFDSRNLTGSDGTNNPFSWANTGPDGTTNISFGFSAGAGADETYISKGYLNLNYTNGVGAGAQCLGTGGSGEVLALPQPAIDGTNFFNISYGALSGEPIDSSGNWQTNMTTNGHSLYFIGSDAIFNGGSQQVISVNGFAGGGAGISISGNDVQFGSNVSDANGVERWSPLNMVFYGNNAILDLNNAAIFNGGSIKTVDLAANQLVHWNGASYDVPLDWSTGGYNSSAALSFGSSKSIALAGLTATYNGISTVKNGIPSLYANSDLTTQAAAISATTLYAVPSTGAGLYRVCYVASITRAASTSSVLGGTNGFQIIYTDPNDSVVKTSVDTAINSSLNTTATSVSGTLIANCKASTNLQFSFGYTSVGVTTMQYDLSIRVEAI